MARLPSLAALAVTLTAGLVMAAAPPGPRVDLHGDPLPPGARARLGTVRLRHGHTVSSVGLSADGKVVVSGASDHTVRLHDARTGRLLRAFGQEEALANVYAATRWVSAVAVSTDGKTVAGGSNAGIVRVWDSATGKEVRLLRLAWGPPFLAFGPGAKTICAGGQRTVRVWDVATGREARQLGGHISWVSRVSLSGDGKTMATGDNLSIVHVWEMPGGKMLRRLSGPGPGPAGLALALSPDAKTVAFGGLHGDIFVYEVSSGKRLRRLSEHTGGVGGLAFLPGGKTLLSAGMRDGLVRLWNVQTGKVEREFKHAGGLVQALALARDGKTLALASGDSVVRLWDVPSGRRIAQPAGHDGALSFLAFSGKGEQVTSAGGDGTVRLWEARTGKQLRLSAPEGPGWAPIAHGGAAPVTAFTSPTGEVLLWGPRAGKGRLPPPAGTLGPASAGAFSGDGRILATAHGLGHLRLWDVSTGKQRGKLTGQKGVVSSLAFSRDGETLASSGSDGTIRLWRVKTGREVRRISTVPGTVHRLAFSRDGRALAGGSNDGSARVWDPATGQVLRELPGHRGYVMAVRFSPDGRSLAAGNWMGVRLWDLATAKLRGEVLGHQGDCLSLAFSPDGKTLATGGSDTTALLWDVSTLLRLAPPGSRLPAEALAARWADLASNNARVAHDAVWALAGTPEQAVALLRKHLRPVQPADGKRLKKLIGDLSAEDDETRIRARRELEALGEQAGPVLRKALAAATDVDVRLQLQVLLSRLDSGEQSAEELRASRALQVLELAGTPAARRLLAELARGAPTARLSREARASLDRLGR
jgi:WD40 repeat protein